MASFLGRGGFLSPGMTGQREVPEMVDPRANPTVGNVTQTSSYPPQQNAEGIATGLPGAVGGFFKGLNIPPGYFEALGAGIANSTGGNYGPAIAAGNLALGKGRKERSEAKAFMDDMRIQYPQMTQAEYDAGLKSKLVRARLYEQATAGPAKDNRSTSEKEYDRYRQQGGKASFVDFVDRNVVRKAAPMTPEEEIAHAGAVAGAKKKGQLDADKAATKQALIDKRQTIGGEYRAVMDAADKLYEHDGLENAVGPIMDWTPTLRDETSKFETQLKRLQGKTFMRMRESLKGAGQVTDYEGQRAEESLLAVQTSMTEGAFKEAMLQFKKDVQRMHEAYLIETGQMEPTEDFRQTYQQFANKSKARDEVRKMSNDDLLQIIQQGGGQ